MKLRFNTLALALGLTFAAFVVTAAAQDAAVPMAVRMASSKFASLPVVPACTTLSAQQGDPSKGASVLLIKMTSGCVIPWHWHSANERLMVVSGQGKVDMKDHPSESVKSGDFVYLPAKGHHQFTCVASCTFFNASDQAFDIHYVKDDGSEISVEEALHKSGKASAHKTGSTTKGSTKKEK